MRRIHEACINIIDVLFTSIVQFQRKSLKGPLSLGIKILWLATFETRNSMFSLASLSITSSCFVFFYFEGLILFLVFIFLDQAIKVCWPRSMNDLLQKTYVVSYRCPCLRDLSLPLLWELKLQTNEILKVTRKYQV